MNKIFQSLAGVALAATIGAGSASAADYTWSLGNLTFGAYTTTTDFLQNGIDNAIGIDGGTASGTFTINETGGLLSLLSYNISTTAGPGGTGYAVNYTSSDQGDFGSAGSSDDFLSNITFVDATGVYALTLVFAGGEILDAVTSGNTTIDLLDQASFESNTLPDLSVETGPALRVAAVALPPLTRVSGDGAPGQLTLVNTPEPASMALLGTGLLGMFMARRRMARVG